MAKVTKQDRENARAELRKMLKPGDTVYTILRRVSTSGMSRVIDLVVVRPKLRGEGHEIVSIAWKAARAMDETLINDKVYGVKVMGCGMDMGFDLVYNLGRTLWPEGFAPSKIGIRPADGKEVNIDVGRGRNAGPLTKLEIEAHVAGGWKFPGGRNGDDSGWDNDGGYALNHQWL